MVGESPGNGCFDARILARGLASPMAPGAAANDADARCIDLRAVLEEIDRCGNDAFIIRNQLHPMEHLALPRPVEGQRRQSALHDQVAERQRIFLRGVEAAEEDDAGGLRNPRRQAKVARRNVTAKRYFHACKRGEKERRRLAKQRLLASLRGKFSVGKGIGEVALREMAVERRPPERLACSQRCAALERLAPDGLVRRRGV